MIANNPTSLSPSAIPLGLLKPDGTPPESRFTDIGPVRDTLNQLLTANNERAANFSRVKGLIDGNLPFDPAKRRKQGLGHLSNFNDRTAMSFVDHAVSPRVDMATEVPMIAEVRTRYGSPEKREEYSRKISEHLHWAISQYKAFDYINFNSIYQSTTFGTGPLFFADNWDWRPIAIQHSKLLVPEGAKANLEEWEICVILHDYLPHQLYACIRNPDIAERIGWDVKAVQDAIIFATPQNYRQNQTGMFNWEFWQQRIRNNDLWYYAMNAVCSVAHVFWKEFPCDECPEGGISQAMITQNVMSQQVDTFLFRHVNRYQNWQQCIAPMYYDYGDDSGTHHSVKGMGFKFFSLLDAKMKLNNMSVDLAVAQAQIMLKPNTDTGRQALQIAPAGPYAIFPKSLDAIPVNFGNRMDGVLDVKRELLNDTRSQLSQYQVGETDAQGQPITATQATYDEQNQNILNKAEMGRFYNQRDELLSEMYRRLANPNYPSVWGGSDVSRKFRKRCEDDQVPMAALLAVDYVRAYRVAGQGSQGLRQAALEKMYAIKDGLPLQTQLNITQDLIASTMGQEASQRYPVDPEAQLPTNQDWQAHIENVSFLSGAPDTQTWWTPLQNNTVHLTSHIQASFQALASLQQGGEPIKVITFVDSAGPNITIHLEKLKLDPTKKSEVEQFTQALTQIGSAVDQIKQQLKAQMQKQQQEAQKQQAPPNPAKLIESMNYKDVPEDIKRQIETQAGYKSSQQPNSEVATAQQGMAMDAAKTQQDLQLKQAKTVQALTDKQAKTQQNLVHKQQTHEQNLTQKAQQFALSQALKVKQSQEKPAPAE